MCHWSRCKDPEKRREFEARWREKNRETLRAKQRQRKRVRDVCVRDLRVVLTPLTRDECQVPVERLQRRKAVTRDVECRACADRARVKAERKEAAKRRKLERNRAWKKANREKVREYKRQWRANNREKLREQKRQWQENNREEVRKQKQQWVENNREKVREQKRQSEKRRSSDIEKRRERKRKWRENNREKVREQKRRQYQANPEKLREQQRTWYQNNREKVMDRKRQWRKDNPEKVRAQGKRRRERLRADEARGQMFREKKRQQNERWRHKYPEKVKAHRKRWEENNPVKARASRGRYRDRRKQRNRQRGRPVPLPPPPCDCGLCVACGGWGAIWKPAWHARLNAFCTPQDLSTTAPAPTLEELPLDLSETEAETLSLASTSEIESELGDRLDSLLMDESDSEVETRDKVETPTRRSRRIAAMPSVSYKDWEEEEKLLQEFLRRKEQLHADGVERIVTRWELLEHRTERVDAIVGEMSLGMDPTHQLDRFHDQLERQDYVLDVMVSEDLLDFVDAQLA